MTLSTLCQSQTLWASAEQSGAAARRPNTGNARRPDPKARAAWRAAALDRDECQARIVRALRHSLEEGGPGPSESELLMFARTAIREQALARALAVTAPVLVARRR
ncbi:MAG: hypothetical protein ABWZ88_12600 [Variovorax sp.]